MNHHRSGTTAPLSFFVGVGALAVPFWMLGPRADPWLQARLPIALPSSALWFVCPVIVALVLTYREAGPVGVTALLKRSVDARNIRRKVWYVPIVLLWPLMMSVEYSILKLAGAALPDPHIPLVMVPVFFGAFSISAWCEQLGWTGYATDPLQRRWGALAASVIVGVIWALGHVVPLIQTHRPPAWIVWQCLGMIPFRILITWIFNTTGNTVFATIVFHATSNVSQFLFPTYGSHYDPFLTCLILAFTAALVTVMWGPQTLAHDGVFSSRGRQFQTFLPRSAQLLLRLGLFIVLMIIVTYAAIVVFYVLALPPWNQVTFYFGVVAAVVLWIGGVVQLFRILLVNPNA